MTLASDDRPSRVQGRLRMANSFRPFAAALMALSLSAGVAMAQPGRDDGRPDAVPGANPFARGTVGQTGGVGVSGTAPPVWSRIPPQPPAAGDPAPTPREAFEREASDRVDLNLATLDELGGLPGVGGPRGRDIVASRPYGNPSELVSKGVLPQSVFDGLRDRVIVYRLNVNLASEAEMIERLPGIGEARAAAIVRGRPYRSPEDILARGILTQGVFNRIRPQLATR